MKKPFIKRFPVRVRVAVLILPVFLYFIGCFLYTCVRVFGFFLHVQVMADAVKVVKACYLAAKTGKEVKRNKFYD